MPEAADLTGQRFGMLTVLERDFSRKGAVYWFCQCDCGNKPQKSIKSSNLKNGNTKSCGCLRGKNLKEKGLDLTNQRFGSLIAIKAGKDEKNRKGWICQCDCGKTKGILTSDLTTGHTTSCGCHSSRNKKHIIDITNQRYGKLIAIKPDLDRKKYWICQCDCGNMISVKKANLRTGNTTSCGCQKSRGEQKILEILKEMGVLFQREKTFPDLFGQDKKLKFDFYLPQQNILIEYQGQQHYEPVRIFGGEECFKKQKSYDILKKEFCKRKNIKLIEIPYWDFKKINYQYLKNFIEEKE